MDELRKKMEERVHLIRQQMEQAAGQAGRAPEEITLLAASKTQSPETVALSAALPIDLFGETGCRNWYRNLTPGPTAANRWI